MDIKQMFANKEEINIVFLGGSITEGAHATQKELCYAGLTSAWLTEQLGGAGRVHCHNKGVGGTDSQYGLFRLNRDVISKKPDLVFLEYAVNDGGRDMRLYMESIVRSLQESCDPYIVFLYTTNESYATDTHYHEELAAYYGIPEISLKDALKRTLEGKNARECGYFTDAVHPANLGHEVYFHEMVRCLSCPDYYKKVEKRPPLIAGSGAVRTEFISSASERVTRVGEWETNTESSERPWAKSTAIGNRLRFSFEGTILGIEHGLHADSCMYEVWIDGSLTKTMHPVYGDMVSNQLVHDFATIDLPHGRHEVEIVTVPSTNERYTGSQTMIYNFIVGDRA